MTKQFADAEDGAECAVGLNRLCQKANESRETLSSGICAPLACLSA